jgi:peptide/nickel transport system permease protein
MLTYILRRILISIPLLLIMSLVTFFFIQLAPGNWFDSLKLNPQISQEIIAQYEAQYHLNESLIVQFFYWLKGLIRLDLGYSFAKQSPVLHVIGARVWNTVLLTGVAILMAWSFAIPIGVISALRQNRATDRFFSFLAFIGMAIPNFFFCLLLLYFASDTGLLPIGGIRSIHYESFTGLGKLWDLAKHLVIPAVVISTASLASLQRLMRSTLLEVLRAPFITVARAKGLSEGRIITKHALRNSINPLVTIFGFEFSTLLSGAALTEIICSWPGLGSLMLDAVRSQDLFLVMGSMLIGGMMLIIGNLLSDCLLAWVDPRIQLR